MLQEINKMRSIIGYQYINEFQVEPIYDGYYDNNGCFIEKILSESEAKKLGLIFKIEMIDKHSGYKV